MHAQSPSLGGIRTLGILNSVRGLGHSTSEPVSPSLKRDLNVFSIFNLSTIAWLLLPLVIYSTPMKRNERMNVKALKPRKIGAVITGT